MAVTRYSTNVTLCEDTSQNFELLDLLRQADPNYVATDPSKLSLYVFDGTKYVETTTGYFTAVDKDTFAVNMAQMPNFNGVLKVRVLGVDSTGSSFILDVSINVTPVNDAPSGADESVALANGNTYVLGVGDFGFTDPVEGDALKSVVITTLPVSGLLSLNGVAVNAGQEILATDIAAGNLTYLAPLNSGGAIGFDFQVRDTGGVAGCGGNDLDLTPNTITFTVPVPAMATLGDRVWLDNNANGVQDAGEAGLQGVTVQLKDNTGAVVKTTTTDANGNYGFEVEPGTYSVAIVTPGGYIVTGQDLGGNEATDSDINAAGQSAAVTLAAGQDNPNVDAGLYQLAELGDRVWIDTNGNGQQDGGEAGVQGVKVTLLDATGAAVGSPLLTDASGNYLFTNLKPGTYSVQFDKATLPAGYSFTTQDSGADASDSDANTADGKTIQTQLDSGESDKTWDAGIVANPGAITGTVRQDNDNNNSGDTPIAGVTVTLKDGAGNIVGTAITDANGNYAFNNLPAGSYTVLESNKPGYLDVNDIDGGNPNSIAVNLNPGQISSGNDFVDELPATLGDRVWLDNNANGVQDAGEAGLQGVTVQLKDNTGAVVKTTTTDANGNYGFEVEPGTYSVAIVTPGGYIVTGQDLGGNEATDSDINAAGQSAAVTLAAGQDNPNVDAGLYQLAELGDRVWIDTNGNGQQDGGEAGVQGVKVTLLDANGAAVGSPLLTDASGNYLFTNLKPGTYSVQFDKATLPAGYSFTTQDSGADATDSDANTADGKTIQTQLDSGESDKTWDAGIVANPGAITGTVRQDNDNNNSGDTPIAGVTVTLKDGAGNIVGTAITDANGNYAFNNLPAGSYTVLESNKPGYLDVNDIDGGNPNSIAVNLNPGQISSGNDFVDELPATLGDRVWLDNNANGVQDAGEAGLQGVTVQLKDNTGAVVKTTTTDANGNYGFEVEPGTYSVAIVTPGGYIVTGQDLGGNEATDSDINAAGQSAAVTLAAGQDNPNVDAGLYQLAELGDRVWIDTNGNGQQDGGEAGVQGVKVTLLDATGAAVGSPLLTDASGNYLFTNLKPGTYSVQFDKATLPAGYSFTTQDSGADATDSDANPADGKTIQTQLDSGESDKTWDAGIVANPGAITGTVRQDNDNNNSGDTPIAGVTVTLKDGAGNIVGTAITDANGNYAFNNLPAGSYTVLESNKPGYLDVNDIDGGNPNSIAVNLNPGQISSGNDFVDELPATLGDRVWLDNNANGVQDAGEAGLQGVTVQLKDNTGAVVKTTTTDANGNYGFEVEPGTYSVAIVTPGGYIVTGQDLGGNEATDSDINAAGQSAAVTLAAGQDNPNVDAGLYQLAELGDRVWIDTNGNGQQDGGEAGVQGVKVTLLDATGAAVGSPLLTDASGNYLFTNLKPGTYSVQFDKATLPAGYSFTTQDSGADTSDSDANPADGKTIQTQLDSGESDKTWDAGIVANPGAITGTVRQDNDNNNSGDTPIAGVTVTLKDGAGNIVGTAITDANGNYAFNNLPAGSYTVLESNKPGYLDVNDIDGGNPNSIAVNLNPGQISSGNDFVDELPATLGDRVWLDNNANGVQDAGEAGLQGVTVKLLDSNGAVVNSMTTDASGNYLFSNLTPGNYAVQIVAPTGYTITGKDLGGNDATDSDIDPTTGKTIVTTLSAGENDLSWDAGLYKMASLGDRVWLDANKNGVQDSGEAGVTGVTVNLLNAAGTVVATSATDASGNYLFQNLKPGSYAVQVVAPNGYVITGKDLGGNDATDSDVDAATGKTVVTTLESGENDLSWDAGLYQNPASIGDRVWLDKNANGVQDAGETGIAGVAVKLLDSSGAVVGSATTDANGNYLFSNLTPGNYAVQIVAPTGYTITGKDLGGNDATDSDIDAATGKTVMTSLTAGENDLSWDAGLYQKASIGDKVWSDCDADGVQDATEAGVGGVVVKLLNAAGTVVATTTTDANGNYLFKDLVPGDYAIQVVALTGTTLTNKDQGGNDALDSDVDNVTGKSVLTTLVSGENDMSWDAGLRGARATASFDFNGNSATDGTDGNIRNYTNNGISVNASAFSRDKTSGAWSSAWLGTYGGGLGVTDSSEGNGSANSAHTIDNSGRVNYVLFEFSKVVTVDKAYLGYVIGDSDMKIWIGNSANAFTSHVTLSDAVLTSMGFTEVNSTTLTSARWADLNAGNIEGNMLIVSAATAESNDYFKIQNLVVSATTCVSSAPVTASIGDRVWEDMNANGVQDAGEAGIAGVTVKLLNSAGAVVATTTTNASGNYLFNNLTPGDFKVQVVKPTGYYTTGKDLGGNDATDSDVDSTGTTVLTTLTAGENDLNWDAGLYRKASIGDRVWEDANHNNLQDAGEAGIASVVVKLQNAAGATIVTTTTNASGNYSFVNLDPGSYRVVFDKTSTIYKGIDMSKWVWSAKDVGANDAIDGDANSATDVATTAYTTLVSGEADMTWDAGITPIVLDLDGNGIQTIAREDSSGKFDLLGTGQGIDSGWISAGDAFLAVDANHDGTVNNLSELFGGLVKGDGFAKLADFDSNGDALIDALDARFSELQVWQDLNGNHQTDAGELRGLSEAGVLSLRTDFVELPAIDAQGNLHLERSSAAMVDGRAIDMADVYFNVSRADAEAAGIELPSLSALLGDDTSLDVLLGANASSTSIATGDVAMADSSMATLSQMVSLYDQQQHDLIAA